MPSRNARSSNPHREHVAANVLPLEKHQVAVEHAEDPALTKVVLTERSPFGPTSVRMSPQATRQIAAYLIEAADAADEGEAPKLAAAL